MAVGVQRVLSVSELSEVSLGTPATTWTTTAGRFHFDGEQAEPSQGWWPVANPDLNEEDTETFHHCMAKPMFVAKRG